MISTLRQSGLLKFVITAAIILAVAVVLFVLPTNRHMVNALVWIETLGVWGPILLSMLYVGATVLFLPGSILGMSAGALFGVWKGFLAAWIGAYLGACAAFILGRALARDWIDHKISQNARISAVEKAMSKEGFKIVFLLRLTPLVPFNLLNYSLSLTSVRFSKYAIASFIGMVPCGFMYVYIGAAAGSLAAISAGEVKGSSVTQVLYWIGFAVTIVVTVLVTRIARKSLKAVEEPPEVGLESGEMTQDAQTSKP